MSWQAGGCLQFESGYVLSITRLVVNVCVGHYTATFCDTVGVPKGKAAG